MKESKESWGNKRLKAVLSGVKTYEDILTSGNGPSKILQKKRLNLPEVQPDSGAIFYTNGGAPVPK